MNKSLPFVVGIIFAIVVYAAWRAYTLITSPVMQALCVLVMTFATGAGMMLLAAGVTKTMSKLVDKERIARPIIMNAEYVG